MLPNHLLLIHHRSQLISDASEPLEFFGFTEFHFVTCFNQRFNQICDFQRSQRLRLTFYNIDWAEGKQVRGMLDATDQIGVRFSSILVNDDLRLVL